MAAAAYSQGPEPSPAPVSATVSLQQLTDQLTALEAEAAAAIAAAADPAALEELRVGLLGKQGRLSAVLGAMGRLSGEERPLVGERANRLKQQLQALLLGLPWCRIGANATIRVA